MTSHAVTTTPTTLPAQSRSCTIAVILGSSPVRLTWTGGSDRLLAGQARTYPAGTYRAVTDTGTATVTIGDSAELDDVGTPAWAAELAERARGAVANPLASRALAIAQAAPKNPAQVYALSSQSCTVTCSLANAATSISSGVQRRPKRQTVGGTAITTVDMAADPAYQFIGTRSLAYGGSFPDNTHTRVPLQTGGSSQAAFFSLRVRFVYDGSAFELPIKCLSAGQFGFRLRVNGQNVACTQGTNTTLSGGGEDEHNLSANSAGSIAAGSFYMVKFDFGSAAQRVIELDVQNNWFGGIWAEPTATITRGPAPRLTLATLGDSMTGGASTATRANNYTQRLADLLGCDGVANLGIGGTGYLSATVGTNDFLTRVPDVVGVAPDILFIFGGQNDQAKTSAELYAAAVALIEAVQLATPRTLIFVVGMWTTGNASATRVTLNAALKSAATDRGVFFIDLIDPTGAIGVAPAWVTGTSYVLGDVVIAATGAPHVCIVAHTSSGSISATQFVGTSWINGTGRVGTTTGIGNGDVMIQSDNIHGTALANDLLERKLAAEALRLLAAA